MTPPVKKKSSAVKIKSAKPAQEAITQAQKKKLLSESVRKKVSAALEPQISKSAASETAQNLKDASAKKIKTKPQIQSSTPEIKIQKPSPVKKIELPSKIERKALEKSVSLQSSDAKSHALKNEAKAKDVSKVLAGKKSTVPELKEPSEKKTPLPISEPVAQSKEVVQSTSEKMLSENAPNLIRVEMPITVGGLAQKLKVSVPVMIKTLIGHGIFANINQLLNEEIIWKISRTLNIPIEKAEDDASKAVHEAVKDDSSQLVLRPPVVTMMGHVDHGKTSLLDAIRKSDVAGKEAGQITQHIGAYNVQMENKGFVTFLDTPGHVAFTSMRARGANVTDVVVLVVAADDGVMPQTIEAINHAQAAGVPIVVAINKSDLPTADVNRVMTGFQKINLMPEEWGGKTIFVKVSAKTGQGIDELLEMLLLEAEILELKANPNRPAQGIILEARLTKNQGSVATLLVQNGTLRIGDIVVAGSYYGKVRSLRNDKGKPVREAGPSYAAEVAGLSGTPEAGDVLVVVKDEDMARKIAEKRSLEIRERAMKGLHTKHLSLEDLYSQVKEGKVKELKIIIKADVQGSVEAITQSLEQIHSDKIQLRVIHGGVGSIGESDIMLAAASDAIVIGFHVKPDDRAQLLLEKEGVDVRFYNIIYQAIQDIQKAMEGLLEPTSKEVFESRTLVQQTFRSSKIGLIGGAIVRKGRLVRNHPIRVLRDNVVVFEGKLGSLKRFKDDVREVQEGYDCGLVVEGFQDLREGDVIESYRIDKVASSLT